MKLKQLAGTFLKVGKIINIILLPVFAILLVVFTIIDIVAIVGAVAAVSDGADASTIGVAVGALIGVIIGYGFAIVCLIVALILNAKASTILVTAQSKQEAKKGAIMAIVAGVLVTVFPLVAGILMLCTKEEDWGKAAGAQPEVVEEKAE